MAHDNRQNQKAKDEETIKPKKKTATPDASPASSSRRSSREASSGKQTKESLINENLINARKSERLEKRKPSSATPTKRKSEKTSEQVITTPSKYYDRCKKSDVGISATNLQSRSPVSRAISNMKSKKKKMVNGNRKRKRASNWVNKGLSKHPRLRTEDDCNNNGKKREEKSSEDNSSSSICRDVEKLDNIKSVEDNDDSDDDCSESDGEESIVKASEKESTTSDKKESSNDSIIDLEQDRTPCEATALPEFFEKNNGVSRTNTSICIACKKLRCYHLPLVTESIWDTREADVSEAHDLQKQKQYFVKYKGLAHIHNQWIPETQLLREAPLLVENYSKNGSMKWNEEWTMPHQLLKKRLLLYLEPVCESQDDAAKVLNYHYEWFVQWKDLDYEQATWESENLSVLDSPEGHNFCKEYEKHHGNAKKHASSDNDRVEEIPVKLPTVFTSCPLEMDNIHSSYVKNLHDAWTKGQNSIVFDDQERTTRIILFLLSLKFVSLPFLLITRYDSLSQWEAMFLQIGHSNMFKISLENTHEKRSSKLLHVHKEDSQLAFQLLLYSVDAFVKDLNVLKPIRWEAVLVDESQNPDISSHFKLINNLSTDKRLLVFCGPLGVSNLNVLPLLDSGVITKTELDDISKLKETLSKLIAYECKSSSPKFVEYWVPVQISDVQLEQYCSMLLSNAMALSACCKSDTTGAVHDILVSNRKCCDHPYIVDQTLQALLTKGLEPVKFLDVGIKASGKLQFLDLILPEMRKRQLRVLIVFQPLSGSGKDSTSIGDILDDFVRQRFGEDSYERVDGIGMIPSKKLAALNNFNNKEMGRFIFLLEYRACLASTKLSSVDTIIIFDGDWNPANDLRALQKIAIDSNSEQIMVFRLYTSLTLEEKILRLAEHNVTIDSKLQNLSRSTSDELLMWGATYLFKKLDEFHNDLNVSSEECWWNELKEEFLDLISYKCKENDAAKLKITRAKPICGKNVTVPNKLDKEQPHTFWRKLLVGRNPCWKYLSRSTPRQRTLKRPQYFEMSPKRTNVNSDDVGRKRKKITNNVSELTATKPVIDEGEITQNIMEPVASKPVVDESEIASEMSFRDLLKLKVSKLCEVLRLSEDVKIMVDRFLKYVIENYRVNKESENTLQAFLISLCWIGSGLLKHKLDRKQSISLANEHLNFSCKEEEANTVYLKLELAKEMFLLHTDNQKKNSALIDTVPEVKIEISDSSSNHNDDDVDSGGGDCNQKDDELGTINPDTSNALENKNNNSSVKSVASPASGQSVPTDLVNEFNLEAALLQPNEPSCLPSENQSNIHHDDSQDPPVLEFNAPVTNQGVTPLESNDLNDKQSGNCNQGVPRKKSYDPLQAEFERLCELKNAVIKFHDAIKLKIKSDQEKELAEVIAQVNAKYETKIQEADTAFELKKNEVDTYVNRVVMNKVLADTFRSKCQDLSPISTSEIQETQSGGTLHLPQFQGQTSSNGLTFSSSPAQSSRSQQVTGQQPPLQIVNQSSKLFSTTPTRPPSGTMPARPPPSTVTPSIALNKPPSATSIPSRLSFHINPVTPTSKPVNPLIPTSKPVNPLTPTSKPVNPLTSTSKPFNPLTPSSRPINHITPTSRPPPNIIPTAPSARSIRASEIRAPAPHIRPFRLPVSSSPHDHRAMPSQRQSGGSPLSQTSVRPMSLQSPPSFPTNHNSHSTQNSPRSSPLTSSQPPSVPPASFSLPPLYSWQPPGTRPVMPSSHPQMSLPPMPSVSVSHTGLYYPAPDILTRSTSDLSMDRDKQGGFHLPNTSSSPPKVLDSSEFGGKESGGSDLVCLSDDDVDN
ncbi:hypothetical protein R6Q57_026811 [Mikania cordata]